MALQEFINMGMIHIDGRKLNQSQKILLILHGGHEVASHLLRDSVNTADYRARICEMRKRGIEFESITRSRVHYYKLLTPWQDIDFVKCRLRSPNEGDAKNDVHD